MNKPTQVPADDTNRLIRLAVAGDKPAFDQVLALAQSARGADLYGYRSEFIQLVKLANALKSE